jgi:Na+/H+ antiporter NhaD/arsenite permease-like protein
MPSTPLWAIFPFLSYLLLIALVPIVFGHFWESNRNKLVVALVVSSPVLILLLAAPQGAQLLGRTACDYLSFMALLAALFTISGGICLHGALVGSPFVNTVFLAVGAVLGSVVGTTGASVLLIRPMLRANARRANATHVVVFFIFIVSNGAGLLTPLGDPPLFLGFLRGVPFTWTFRLAPQWALVNGALLVIFAVIDAVKFARERRRTIRPRTTTPAPESLETVGPLRIEGGLNFLWLAGMVALVFLLGSYGERYLGDGYLRAAVQVGGTLGFAALSFKTTAPRVHEINRFSWGPIAEVAAVFVGVFITMVPAMSFLAERGSTLGITKPWQFFWASGALSSVLDNAPTYLTFASLATGVASAGGAALSPDNLGALAAHPVGRELLTAISCGAVFMGAVTYMGNGPNFMVKAIAEQHRVRMPSFFGYTLWSFAILIPIFGIVSAVFF